MNRGKKESGRGKRKGKGKGKGNLSISKATGFGCSGVLYFRCMHSAGDEWYCVDLESLPEKISPIALLSFEWGGNWTVADEEIYYTGGIKHPYIDISRELYKYNTRNPNSDWVTLPSPRTLPRKQPFMVSKGNKIYALGGNRYLEPHYTYRKVEDDWTWWGEVYDLNSQTWKAVLPLPNKNRRHYSSRHAAFNREQNKVVFYSLTGSALLFYDIDTDKFHEEFHPFWSWSRSRSHRAIFVSTCSDEEELACEHESLALLEEVIWEVRPVLTDSTLYWFSCDLRLYGYDFAQKKWLRSTVIENFWLLDGILAGIPAQPILFDLYNGTFLVIVRPDYEELGMATLAVSRKKGSLRVSMKVRHSLPVAVNLIPADGIVMLKNGGSSYMLGEGKAAMED